MLDQILEAWRTNNRINLFLIDAIDAEGMKCTLSKRGGRNVVRQFCHMHNNRVWQLEARAKDLAEGLRFLLRLSDKCLVPELSFLAPDGRFGEE